ncbi:hypothetical protein ACFQRL_00040 [Microbacterium fluvii]|uniref:Uncharacterized protein n=1 Tax=Microbacterium fluvii TaxID=415215 RepID=A0ABW2HA92_9MICO|nr:hypothetical protein [Microbacterium fluvii]MCU4670974.1 hypothetical protein [Microbacterium fluvii]
MARLPIMEMVFLVAFWLVCALLACFTAYGLWSWVSGAPFDVGRVVASAVATGGIAAFANIQRNRKRSDGADESDDG